MVAVIGSVAVLAACGGSSGVSASTYVASICKAAGAWEHTAEAQGTAIEGKIPTILAQAVNGGAAVLARARTLLLAFTNELVTATKTVENAIAAAGTPNVKNGSTIASKLHDDFANVVTALESASGRVKGLSTSSVAAFQSGSNAALQSIESSLRGATSNVPDSPELDAAGKKAPACIKLGFTP
jgi:hypothetical protein